MKKIIFIFVFILPFCILAQNVIIDKEESIVKMEQKYKEVNKRVSTITMYVIQVASLSGAESGTKAQSMVKELNNFFASSGIEATAYSTFVEPCHKIQVGNFSTRESAYAVLIQLPSKYATAFVKQDQRKVSEIIN